MSLVEQTPAITWEAKPEPSLPHSVIELIRDEVNRQIVSEDNKLRMNNQILIVENRDLKLDVQQLRLANNEMYVNIKALRLSNDRLRREHTVLSDELKACTEFVCTHCQTSRVRDRSRSPRSHN